MRLALSSKTTGGGNVVHNKHLKALKLSRDMASTEDPPEIGRLEHVDYESYPSSEEYSRKYLLLQPFCCTCSQCGSKEEHQDNHLHHAEGSQKGGLEDGYPA
jgi:hypothetical protein